VIEVTLLYGLHFSDVSALTKNERGYILGDFFTNSSGHPGLQKHCQQMAQGRSKLFKNLERKKMLTKFDTKNTGNKKKLLSTNALERRVVTKYDVCLETKNNLLSFFHRT
jgi:hypothetical protein